MIRRWQRRATPARKAGAPVYDETVIGALQVIWMLMDFPCGKRLQPVVADVVDALGRHGELNLEPETWAGPGAMSAAMIYRHLPGDGKRLRIKGPARPSRTAC